MDRDPPPASLPTAELCRRCREETGRYRRHEPSDDHFCFELIRRAVVLRDEQCWEELYAVYRDYVVSWCRKSGAESSMTEIDELVTLTWEKFWHSYTPEKLQHASGAAAVLGYLKMCARSVVLDQARGRSRNIPLDEGAHEQPDTAPTPSEHHAGRAVRQEFWAMIDRHLHDERERILVHLRYELGLKPSEVYARHPELFPTIQDVYRVIRNVIDRLRRSKDLGDWLADGGL